MYVIVRYFNIVYILLISLYKNLKIFSINLLFTQVFLHYYQCSQYSHYFVMANWFTHPAVKLETVRQTATGVIPEQSSSE